MDLHAWVDQNRRFLVLLLAGGLGFFALLAGVYFWKQKSMKPEAAVWSLLEQANKSRDEKKWDECVLHYKAVYKKSNEALFHVLALHGVGTCLRGKGDWNKSAETFKRASLEPGHIDPLLSRFEEIRSYQFAKNPKAMELYQNLLKEPKLSGELKEKIDGEIAWLQKQPKP